MSRPARAPLDGEREPGTDTAADPPAVEDGSPARICLLSGRRTNDSGAGHGPWYRVGQVALLLVVLGVLGAEADWLAPRIGAAGSRLAHPEWSWLLAAIAAEMASMATFARLQRTLLRVGGVRVRIYTAMAATLAANAMSVTLPGGAVVSAAYTYRRMRSWGAGNALVAFGITMSGVLSTVAFVIIALVGTTLAGKDPNFATFALEIIALVIAVLAVRRLLHRPDLLHNLGARGMRLANRVLRRPPTSGIDRGRELIDELIRIRPRTRDWARGLWFAMLNWITDMICLIAACHAVGADGPTLGVAVVAYTAGVAASNVPLLPGGLGVVDAALILALSHGGLSATEATAGVLLYRLISFALIAAIGWVVWLLQRVHERRSAGAGFSETPAAETPAAGFAGPPGTAVGSTAAATPGAAAVAAFDTPLSGRPGASQTGR